MPKEKERVLKTEDETHKRIRTKRKKEIRRKKKCNYSRIEERGNV
jgi:hypothetical protein